MEELYALILIPIIIGLIVGIILLILEKTNWKGLFIKTRVLWILKRYDRIKDNPKKEAKYVRNLGFLLDKGKNKIQAKGFSYYYDGDTIQDADFGIHLTRRGGKGSIVHQFLIRRLDHGKIMTPDMPYFSEGYHITERNYNPLDILNEFITYFKGK